MAKNKDLKVDVDIDTRDLEISILRVQNKILKGQVDMWKYASDQKDFNLSHRTIKQAEEEFLNRVATAFKETYGYDIESSETYWKDSMTFQSGIRQRKTFYIEINTVGAD